MRPSALETRRILKGFRDEDLDILHTPCPRFDEDIDDYLDTFHEMFVVMEQSRGVGLAAPQVGLQKRFFIMNVNEPIVCINPEIVDRSEEMIVTKEGCLSYPNLFLNVKRHAEVRVRYTDDNGDEIVRLLNGLEARCFQHELDHLDGVTFDTLVSKLALRRSMRKRRIRAK